MGVWISGLLGRQEGAAELGRGSGRREQKKKLRLKECDWLSDSGCMGLGGVI